MSNSYNVRVGNLNKTRVRLGSQNATQVVASNLSSAGQVIGGIAVDLSNIQDNFVLQYDANLNKIIACSPTPNKPLRLYVGVSKYIWSSKGVKVSVL